MSLHLKRKLDSEETDSPSNKKFIVNHNNTEEKISRLVNAVQGNQHLGHLVIIVHDESENPYVTLQNALPTLNVNLTVSRSDCEKEDFVLQIDGEEYAKGVFQNMQIAKRQLAEETVKKLKDICFFIQKKRDFVNVTKENLQGPSSSNSNQKTALNSNSIAHKIMLKMGWAGGGLGVQEQGNPDSVMLYENVNRQGLGSNNLMKEISKKLDNFSKSSNLLTLVFNADFTKEERALIHRVARKFNLKSKSTGSESRRLTVSKKITRIDIVRELLRIGGEDGLYKLHIPQNFKHLWT